MLGCILVLLGALNGPVDDIPVAHSIGTPRAGRLLEGVRLPAGPGYKRQHPDAAFGTPTTVAHLLAVLAGLHRERPDLAPLLVGDLSARRGGRLPAHRSHQSGRDVDLGLYRSGRRSMGRKFHEVPPERLDAEAVLVLVELLAKTRGSDGGVEWILLDYDLQGVLYEHAAAGGATDAELDLLFQYPRGRTASRGLIRHFRGHKSHLHVRFGCAEADPACRSPSGPPGSTPR